MAAATISLPNIDKYATYSVPITFSSDFCNGTPIDLTGCTADMMIRASYTSASIIELSTSNGRITIPTPTNGTLNLIISQTVTATLPSGVFLYDLLITFSNGTVTRFLQGNVTILDGITHV